MDDGELDFSNQEVFSNSNMDDIQPSSCSMDTFFDELLRDSHACTHTHTCNPPGPESTHTHTCFHVHTKILPAQSEEKVSTDDTAEFSEKKNKKRPSGNREAVRKYREKKKARAASLEDEVIKLRANNQQLLKRLQGQAALEAEVARLKCLLVDIRGRIEGEIGAFPYQKPMSTNFPSTNAPFSYMMNPCNLQCDDEAYCLHPGVGGNGGEGAPMNGQGLSGCDFGQLQCLANQNSGTDDLPASSVGNVPFNSNTSGATKRKGGPRAAKVG
ncbi:PREDICTED: basic leucine zipper 19 [Tarenaya hassleriana]|uniref:basic leucine zipper 19 n=1 Tax=Tarenaya hassleriana TaxID=28532 RepID=UPI00053C11B3|nr:PREDICTED: basic leucine zipper 19 [Tarenaya hassleriana]XP_010530901.1 PREDICTED: basic leucine zipper 19 [Tarenaya hassleriana]XP_010530902.1 PREDICTED: basic leucine zipper 19 [Tarenaya hassleriana]XP_010530904.1 PREDICTED: basic leucine zipper 19 [Tarenaya hassleriana]XP_010530905.1 PREDICTED: basic leucine zipper 19 [Tarenaya hassleriana]XP_010530906.1 PREDICTED: basic leucine zipper 19 [Tarenaya hassleriana]XP_010530907.1 PREDICTED: basic leucine zipper 19 [Tarenaya hassleriana]XP_0